MTCYFPFTAEFAGNKTAYDVLTEHAGTHGNIFSIRIGQRWTVVLNGVAVIKEALLKKGVEFANRPTSFTSKSTCYSFNLYPKKV